MEQKFTGLNFNAAEVKPDLGREPIPADWYNAVVVDSDVKPTADGTGQRANIQFKILDGKYANRVVFNGYNVKNKSPKAEEIGRAQFSALCHAVGVLNLQSTTQLHGIPVKIKVKVVPETDKKDAAGNIIGKYDAKNEVSSVKNINESEGGAAPVASGPKLPDLPEMPAGFSAATAAKQPWEQPAASTSPSGVSANTAPTDQPAWANSSPTQPVATATQAAAVQATATPLPAEAAAAQAAMPAWAQQQPQT